MATKYGSMLGPMVEESAIRERWLIVRDELDERGRRMWAAAEARSHGRGGIAAVVRATGINRSVIGVSSWRRLGLGWRSDRWVRPLGVVLGWRRTFS